MATTPYSCAAVERAEAMATTRHIAVARFYCSYGDLATHEPANILGSFINQLVAQHPELYSQLWMPTHDQSGINLQSSTQQPTLGAIQQYLIECAGRFEKLYLFLDALNECSDYERITTSLSNVLLAAPNIRLMISGTPEVDLGLLNGKKDPERQISTTVTSMPSTSLEPDIRAFVENQISVLPNLQGLSDQLKTDILSTLVGRADGM
jgi:hypothetical protein